MNEASAADLPNSVERSRRGVLAPWLLLSIAAAVYLFDLLVKNWVVATLPEGRSVPVLGEFLQWHFVRNPGAAFSMASGATWIFTILAAVVVGVILWQLRRLRSRWWALFLGLLLGGVLGNLTDRLTRDPGFPVGHVIDFIYTPWMMPAIYNIADIGIVVGMGLFVVLTLFGVTIEGERRSAAAADDGEGESAEQPDTSDPGDADERGRADGTA